MEWQPREQCLYVVLNAVLRKENRDELIPWFLYLKLILTSLDKLPSHRMTVWRGVRLDLTNEYQLGQKHVWWAFSSCTESLSVLKSDLFLGKKGKRTMFNIECDNGKKIRAHSYIAVEDEILLLPATQFVVKGHFQPSDDDPNLQIIHLKQVEPPFPLREPASPNMGAAPNTTASTISKGREQYSHTKVAKPVKEFGVATVTHSRSNKNPKQEEQKFTHLYRNPKVEERILDCQIGGLLYLECTSLTAQDMSLVIQLGIIQRKICELNHSGSLIGPESIRILADGLSWNKTLKMLYLSDNRIGDEGAVYLAHMLETNGTLCKLTLYFNYIGDRGAQALMDALCINNTLQTLILDHNNITSVSGPAVGKMLGTNKSLTVLNLTGNKLNDEGINVLAQGEIITLTHLQLGLNEIGDKGAISLSVMLRTNSTLNILELWKNCIGDEGATALMNIIYVNITLKDLKLYGNCLTDACIPLIEKTIQFEQRTLTELSVGNQFTKEGLQHLEKVAEIHDFHLYIN